MLKRVLDPAFDMKEPILKDESVRDNQYYSYEATAPNQRDELMYQSRIQVDISCLLMHLLKSDVVANTPYGPNVQVGFVNNGIMALFRSALYNNDIKEIEMIQDNVDVATTIVGLTRYSDDYTRSAGPTVRFAKDNSDDPDHRSLTIGNVRNAAGGNTTPAVTWTNANYNLGFAARKIMLSSDHIRFSCAIPLSHIVGFFKSVWKVIFGANHSVVLQQKGDDNDAIWREGGAVAAGKVILFKLALWMPVISPSIAEEQRLLSFKDAGGKSLISWLTTSTYSIQGTGTGQFTRHIASHQGVPEPRQIFVALQANARVNSQLQSHLIFDKLNVSEVTLRINGHQEPFEDILINFENNQVARTYHRLIKYMARDQNIDTGLQISQLDFTTLYPIYYFSLEHLDLTKQSVVDIHSRANVGEYPADAPHNGITVGFRAFAVILSDKAMLLEGAGGRMKVINSPV